MKRRTNPRVVYLKSADGPRGSRTKNCIQSIARGFWRVFLQSAVPQLLLDSQNGSKALKRMRRAREDGHSWSFAPQLP